MMVKRIGFLILIFVMTFISLGQANSPVVVGSISIAGDRWIRPTTGPNTAAYLTITNTSDQSDKLVRVECDESKVVEIHNHINDNGVMKMRPVDFIEIGKNPVEMKPGGLHIMLMGLKDSFQGKETIPLTLYFEKAGSVKVDFPIRVPGSAS
jgi:copper(I)-binding protein